MSISTFGGISSNVNSDGNIIGELINVPTNFKQTGYVDAGSTFSATQYPSLAAVTPPQFSADLWVSNNVPSTLPVRCTNAGGSTGQANPTVGTPIQSATFGGEFFVFFSKGQVFRTTGGNLSSFAYYTTIAVPPGSTVAQVMVANTNMYVSFSASTQMSVFSEITLTTIAYSTIPSAGAWNVTYGNGTYFGYRATTTTVPYFSTDGVTWTAVPSYAATTGSIVGIDWNGTNWLLATSATSGNNHATSTTGTTGASWTGVASGLTAAMILMRYNPVLGLYFTLPSAGSASIYSSPTGAAGSWTSRKASSSATGLNWLDISSNGTMIATAPLQNAAMWIYSSPDGINWANTSPGTASPGPIQSLSTTAPTYGAVTCTPFLRSFGATMIVIGLFGSWVTSGAVATNTYGQYSYCTSTNSMATLSTPTPMFMANNAATVYPPVYLSNGTTGMIMEFNAPGNKPTWTAGISTNAGVLPTEVPSTAFQGPYYTITTNGGQTWNTPVQIPVPTGTTAPITWKGGFATGSRFVVLGTIGSAIFITTSPDGVNWTSYTTPSASTTCFTVGESIYLGSYVSTNYGATWTATVGTFPYYLNGNFVTVASGGGTFCNVANMLVGPATASIVPTLTALSVTNTPWCTGPKGSIVTTWSTTSPYSSASYLFSLDNGASWTLKTFPLAINPMAAFFSNGYFIVFYSPSSYLYSTDGSTWLQGALPGSSAFQNYWALQGSNSNSLPLLAGAAGSYVGPDTTTYRVPYTAPFTAGSKWTVKAQ
jgi:hypothetical protein